MLSAMAALALLAAEPARPTANIQYQRTAGAGIGASADHRFARPIVQLEPAPVMAAALPPVPAQMPAAPSRPAPVPVASARPSPHLGHRAPAAESEPDGALAAENNLAEAGRSALARGRPADALEMLQKHATQFPQGRLAAEREALAIQALVGLGRVDQAKPRDARFHRDDFDSLFGPAAGAALAPR